MISKLAQQTIEKMQMDGLKPTFADIVNLNNAGLALERNPDVFSFSAAPRIAFLGDWILKEPTIAKRVWMDSHMQIFSDDNDSRLYFICYALNCPDNELPDAGNTKTLTKAVADFRDEVLIRYTYTQLIYAVDYVLNGTTPDFSDIDNEEEKANAEKDFGEIYEPPEQAKSLARQLLLQAVSNGIDSEIKDYATIPELERMIVVASLYKGADILKTEHNRNAGQFYKLAGKIRKRLISQSPKIEG